MMRKFLLHESNSNKIPYGNKTPFSALAGHKESNSSKIPYGNKTFCGYSPLL